MECRVVHCFACLCLLSFGMMAWVYNDVLTTELNIHQWISRFPVIRIIKSWNSTFQSCNVTHNSTALRRHVAAINGTSAPLLNTSDAEGAVRCIGHLAKCEVVLPNITNEYHLSTESKNSPQRHRHRNHGITYRSNLKLDVNDITCKFKKTPLSYLGRNTRLFKKFEIYKYFPKHTPKELFSQSFNNCALVSSSSYLNGSGLGKEIDMHDAVIRFNTAPTEHHEKDVGSKTTIRVLNHQAFMKKGLTDKHITNGAYFIWKGGYNLYRGNIYEFYTASQDMFIRYFKWLMAYPELNAYLVHPGSLWRQWDTVQDLTSNSMKKTTTSSGFIGITIGLQFCNYLDVYGHVTNQTYVCHYYDVLTKKTRCTTGKFHPINEERQIVRRMNIGNVDDIEYKGRVTLNGFPTVHCP
ncbi:beta-galactoside alpha-2,6-sialyltransferase 2-like [Saccoglossus kowalevskii]|uniref:beta-galactoside alpha-(2,6)-sialyltransferase n=1 Tax=Saccoglossus kowalevskii TaxID=10224 RepID=A0ABM0MUQ3_SACKO|nr:PREDICTED: beta-galactoside alpha-2,6-sialyltransferase 2-like [Saccoglossus kowalevskii]